MVASLLVANLLLQLAAATGVDASRVLTRPAAYISVYVGLLLLLTGGGLAATVTMVRIRRDKDSCMDTRACGMVEQGPFCG